MKQDFASLALKSAETPSRAARLMDLVTEYFAYVGVIGVAVCVAVMTLAFSAAVGIQLLDKLAKPGFFETEIQQTAPVTKMPAVQPFAPATFAMMPGPASGTKDDVISSNY
jgi:hypothetical protein